MNRWTDVRMMAHTVRNIAKLLISFAFSALTLLVGHKEEHLAYKKILSDEVLAWLSLWNEVQMICIWSS